MRTNMEDGGNGTSATAGGLPELRREIDRIDADMHALLMARGRIIDRLIATKGTAASGSAFRPEREAAMMRVLAARHEGQLPLDAVEGIWRVIISTFTHVQAPFAVHADLSSDPVAAQDSARFHFGFTVPLRGARDAASVVDAVAASRGDLGLVPIAASGPWWQALEAPGAPKVIARLPFLARAAHPAGLPVLVVSKVASEEGVGAVVLRSVRDLDEGQAAAIDAANGTVVARAGRDALVALGRDTAPAVVGRLLGPRSITVGSYPAAAEAERPR